MSDVTVHLDLSWAEHGQEWLKHLNWQIYINGLDVFGGSDEELLDQIVIRSGEEGLHSELWVSRGDDGQIVCTIVDVIEGVDFGDPPTDQFEPWHAAILAAAALVGTMPPAVWNAVLGVRPQHETERFRPDLDRRPGALAAPCSLGPVRLEPGGVAMHEMPDAYPDRIGEDRFPVTSWPLIVEGHATSHGEDPEIPAFLWPMDERTAQSAAHRTCALLTLVWNECWIVRLGPTRVAPGDRLHVPHLPQGHDLGRSNWADGCTLSPEQEPVQPQDRQLPAWAGAAWSAVDQDTKLAGALSAYYEAWLVETAHPSLAAMLYVTVIEGIGARIVDLTPPCSECGQSKGATKRFYKGLRTVLPRKEADALNRYAYERRSRTAHVGTLHGAETLLGRLPDSEFHFHDTQRFEEGELNQIRQAARDVLIHALQAQDTAAEANAR